MLLEDCEHMHHYKSPMHIIKSLLPVNITFKLNHPQSLLTQEAHRPWRTPEYRAEPLD